MRARDYFTSLLMFTALALVPVALSAQQSQGSPRTRQGFWFSGGLGYGSLGCKDCDTREGGLSGGLSVGGTLSQKVRLGLGTTGWTKSQAGVTLRAGTLTALVRFYPSATGGFFLTGGLGLGTVNVGVAGAGSASKTGAGAVLGLGYDVRVARNLSLTPYYNGAAISHSDGDANYGQVGLAITLH